MRTADPDGAGAVILPAQQRADDAGLAAIVRAVTAAVVPPDAGAGREAADRQARLTKPRGALGELEGVSIRLAAMSGQCPPPVPARPAVAVFAGDHGVHAQGISPWPQEVTGQMVANFLNGGAAVNAIARQVGSTLLVVDVGVATPLAVPADQPRGEGRPEVRFENHRVRAGTRDLSREPAMARAEAVAAVLAGAEVAEALIDEGHDLLVPGDMGIGNTTAAAVLIAAFTGAPAAAVTGRGTGIDDAMLAHKIQVVSTALGVHQEAVARWAADPVTLLAAVGGLEHAAITGFLLAAAARRVPVVLDGVNTAAAALVARALAAPVMGYLFAGHRSAEPGHTVALKALGLSPLVDLGLRLGEGSGGLLAVPLVQTAARILGEMATFDAAGVAAAGTTRAG